MVRSATRRTERSVKGRLKVVMCPCKWTSQGLTAAVEDGSSTAGVGCLPGLCGPDTEQCNRNSPGAPLHNLPRERKGAEGGKNRQGW